MNEARLAAGYIDMSESDKPKTRKEIREERLKKEQDAKNLLDSVKNKTPEVKEDKRTPNAVVKRKFFCCNLYSNNL
jgi:hypothetical protein